MAMTWLASATLILLSFTATATVSVSGSVVISIPDCNPSTVPWVGGGTASCTHSKMSATISMTQDCTPLGMQVGSSVYVPPPAAALKWSAPLTIGVNSFPLRYGVGPNSTMTLQIQVPISSQLAQLTFDGWTLPNGGKISPYAPITPLFTPAWKPDTQPQYQVTIPWQFGVPSAAPGSMVVHASCAAPTARVTIGGSGVADVVGAGSAHSTFPLVGGGGVLLVQCAGSNFGYELIFRSNPFPITGLTVSTSAALQSQTIPPHVAAPGSTIVPISPSSLQYNIKLAPLRFEYPTVYFNLAVHPTAQAGFAWWINDHLQVIGTPLSATVSQVWGVGALQSNTKPTLFNVTVASPGAGVTTLLLTVTPPPSAPAAATLIERVAKLQQRATKQQTLQP